MEPFLSGAYTVGDNHLYKLLKEIIVGKEKPTTLAGMIRPVKLHKRGRGYLQNNDLKHKLN
ncbi:hypothetical protein [Bacillus sp. ME78]|nr:hypothetical protein [Bacillus sp. ME78]